MLGLFTQVYMKLAYNKYVPLQQDLFILFRVNHDDVKRIYTLTRNVAHAL